jgi:predicted ABC-type ATPase
MPWRCTKRCRLQSQRELEGFIEGHIAERRSFAYETTLRTLKFEQAQRATNNGFRVQMLYIAAGDVDEHLRRVAVRGATGGHVATDKVLREIYRRSVGLLPEAFAQTEKGAIELLTVYHNPARPSGQRAEPERIVEMVRGVPHGVARHAPTWFTVAMRGTRYELEALWQRAQDDSKQAPH